MTPAGFGSWREFVAFGVAREYQRVDTNQPFESSPGRIELTGKALSVAVIKPLDVLLQGIRNPLVILSLTMVSLFFVSIAFYPAQTWAILSTALPMVKQITASHIQAACYALSQATILGLGLQAFGRFSNQSLMAAHRAGEIRPVPIGAVWLARPRAL